MLNLIIQSALVMMAFNILVVLYFIQRKFFAERRAANRNARQKASLELITNLYYDTGGMIVTRPVARQLKKTVSFELLARLYSDPRFTDLDRLNQLFNTLGFGRRIQRMLRSRFWWNKALAAYLINKTRRISDVPKLITLMKNSKNLDVIINCGEAVLHCTGSEHYQAVIESFTRSRLISYRQILTLLIHIDSKDFHRDILNAASESSLFQRLALETLSTRGDHSVLPLVRKSLSDSNKEVIISALKAIENLMLPVDDLTEQGITSLLDHDAWQVRSFAAKALRYGSDSSHPLLKKLMQDVNWNVRHNAALSLAARDEQGCLCLSEMLVAEDRFARDMAWQTIRQIELIISESAKSLIQERMVHYQKLNHPEEVKA